MARQDGVTLGDIAQKLLGPAFSEFLEGVAQSTLPDCICCSKKAVPLRCIRCGSFCCLDHGYFSPVRREAICRPCIRDVMKEAGGIGDEVDPFEVLGISERRSKKADIMRAYRLKSRSCHPDRYPGDRQKAEEWRRLQWAKEAALDLVKG